MESQPNLPGAGLPCSVSLLPTDHEPHSPPYFPVERIYLAKGSLTTPERQRFVERICGIYPSAARIECPDTSHNRIDLHEADALKRHRKGKKTLVFGELADSVRFSSEEGNTCPNYWHFSTYGFCPYGCKYCYLAGTRGVWFSPTVKIFVNLEEVLSKIDNTAKRLGKPTAFYLGKLQDGLALDPLTAFSTVLVPFFAEHPIARQVILTKSGNVERLLGLEHKEHTILSWSLNPPEVARLFEQNVPTVDERLDAMRKCDRARYPLRAVIMPVIPVDGWQSHYLNFVTQLLAEIPIQRLTLGGICSYRNARILMERNTGSDNVISESFERGPSAPDGRQRYPENVRVEMYRTLINAARQVRPDIELALCLEERPVWEAVGLAAAIGRCNCVL